MRKKLHLLFTLFLLTCLTLPAHALPTDTLQCDTLGEAQPVRHPAARRARIYSDAAPLVYEDMWDLWPYSFLNEHGEPDGFNVELIKLLMHELNIPYVVKLKEKQDAFEDLRDGRSDLILGLSAGYHDSYGHYSENTVTLFTQSVASPRQKPVEIATFKDLSTHRVFVNDSSLCHHLMIDYGWGDNAIPYSAVKLALQKVSNEGEGAVVWNTLSLKWLINKYHIDDIQLTPINMPHGEYKFMSNDPVLLRRLDSVYSALDSSDRLTDLRNKWFYPERQETGVPSWVWWLAAAAGLFALILGIYAVAYNLQAGRLAERNEGRNKRLALILETSRVKMWTYLVGEELFEWRNEKGQVAYTYTMDEFAHRYQPEDFNALIQAIRQLAATERPAKERREEPEVKLSIKARDVEDGAKDVRDFVVVLSVLHRDKQGKPTVILGTKRDVTEMHRRERADEEAKQRYATLFHLPTQGIILFSAQGVVTDINEKACEMFGCERDIILAEKVSWQGLLNLHGLETEQLDGYRCTHTFDFAHLPLEDRKVLACRRMTRLVCGMELKVSRDAEGGVEEIMAVCCDLTQEYDDMERLHQITQLARQADDTLSKYFHRMNDILRDGNIRMLSYSPQSHTLSIYKGIGELQHSLTQTRCMTLVDESAQNKAMHVLNDMDNGVDREMQFDLRSCLSRHGQYPLHFLFHFIPIHQKGQAGAEEGGVVEYFGLCQDITEQKTTDFKLLHEAMKVQEVENTKTSFIRNMVQEIHTPMDAIVAAADVLNPNLDADSTDTNCDVILRNSTYLLHLIDNILYLSRLEAHMIEVVKQPCDFVDTFTTYCVAGRLNNESITFAVENPYDQLVVNIDAQKVGNVIERVLENAIQHTHHGFIRARYDYIGRRLMISIEDTGDGIPQAELDMLNAQTAIDARSSSGLGIPICKELLAQMGGHMEINSEEGLGTTVWIVLPCQATTMKRKKMA